MLKYDCDFRIGDVVVLKTKPFENQNPKLTRESIKAYGVENTMETSFISPHMVVINISEKNMIKCTWYNHNTGKFSEREFIKNALEKAENKQSVYQKKQNVSFFLKYFIIFFSIFAYLQSPRKF